MTDETVMDAINEALGVGGTPHDDANHESGDTGTNAGDSDAGTDEAETGEALAAGAEQTGEGDEAGKDGAGEGEDAGKEGGSDGVSARRADGTFKSKQEIETERAATGKKPGDGDAATAKKPDAINDPIPKELKQETQERIRTLVNTAKEITAERDKFRQDFDYLVQGVQATGATPEQYGETLSWLAMFNSNDPVQQKKALELVDQVADKLATLLGVERNVGDPLAAHADLKEAVRLGKVTAEYAKEIARNRNSSQFRTELTTTARATQEQQQAHERALTTAKSDLSALEVELRAKDPLYDTKKATLVPILKPIFQTIHPTQWKQAFQQAYDQLKVSAPAKKPTPINQPMRAGKQPAGGGKQAPGSMLDAVNGALASIGR